MTDLRPIRVLIADGHPVTLEGLGAIIRGDPGMMLSGCASDGRRLVEMYRELIPDVVVLELRLPALDGLEATRAIMEEFPRARVIILTSSTGEEAIYQAMKAGARTVLFKDSPVGEVLDSIRAVYSGERRVSAAVGSLLEQRRPGTTLTRREIEVLKLVADGLTNREIGSLLGIAESTVKWYVLEILGKMGATDRTEAVAAAFRRGLINPEQT